MIKAPTLCIHHAPCADGFTAAWVVWTRFGSVVKFHPGVHGEAPPDVTGEHVVIVDFSYPRDVLDRMIEQSASLLVLDHHQSAQVALQGLPEARQDWDTHVRESKYKGCVQFDMDRSGARMAWDFFFPGLPTPALVKHVEDRDLWRFALPYTREIQSWVFSHDYEFPIWNELAERLNTQDGRAVAAAEGVAIERKHRKDVRELVKETRRFMTIAGVRVPVVNVPYTMASDAAGTLAEEAPFAASYFDRADGMRVFSLRSRRDGGADVSIIASEMGKRLGTTGGGHARSAGFQAPLGWEGEAA